MVNFTQKDRKRLQEERNIWFVSVRKDGRPHMVPLWFVFISEKFYVCTPGDSIKVKNLRDNPHVVLSLEDGFHAFICEGIANLINQPFDKDIVKAFDSKFEWTISGNKSYNTIIEVVPRKILKFNDNRQY